MNKTDEERVIAIGKALGAGGRIFSSEDVVKVDNFIFEAEVNFLLAQTILNGEIYVGIDESGELVFSDDPAKFKN